MEHIDTMWRALIAIDPVQGPAAFGELMVAIMTSRTAVAKAKAAAKTKAAAKAKAAAVDVRVR